MILIASIVVWFLSYYPRERTDDAAVTNYENSYLGRIGQACEPVFTPLGLNWKAGVALISGISAKEIVVSTLGVLYAEETPAAAGGGPEGTADATRRIASGEASQTAVQKTIIGGADGETAIRVADVPEEEADEERTLGAGNCSPAATSPKPRYSGSSPSSCSTSPASPRWWPSVRRPDGAGPRHR